jgi:hypothetical protein
MPTLDLHGLRLRDALNKVFLVYNQEVRSGFRTRIRVIHGYGSSGVGGVIRLVLREQLASHGVRFETGEYAESNPGVTTVFVGTDRLPKGFLTCPPMGTPKGNGFNTEFLNQLKEEMRQLQTQLGESEGRCKELEKSVGLLGEEKDGLSRQLRERDQRLTQLESRLGTLAGRHRELEEELGSHKLREEELLTRQRNLAQTVGLKERRLREQAAGELRRIHARRAELKGEQERLNREREALSAERGVMKAARAELERKRKTQVDHAGALVKRIAALRRQNEELQRRLKETESWGKGEPLHDPRRLVLVLSALVVVFLSTTSLLTVWHLTHRGAITSSGRPLGVAAVAPAVSTPPGTVRADTAKVAPPPLLVKPPPAPESKPVIAAEDAARFVGKERTVELTVLSTKDLGWGVMLNSESDFRSPKNFTAVLEKRTAVAKYQDKGVRDVEKYFRGKRIKVTGSVRAYRGKAEMTVTQPEQIEVVP